MRRAPLPTPAHPGAPLGTARTQRAPLGACGGFFGRPPRFLRPDDGHDGLDGRPCPDQRGKIPRGAREYRGTVREGPQCRGACLVAETARAAVPHARFAALGRDAEPAAGHPAKPCGAPRPLTQVKALKSAWHVDGTWPLIGYDEAEKHRVCPPEHCVVRFLHVSSHRHKDLVRNEEYERAKRNGAILPCKPASGGTAFVEKSADAIAAAYAARAAQQGTSGAKRGAHDEVRTRRASDAGQVPVARRASDASRPRRPSDAVPTRRPSDTPPTRRLSDASRPRRPSDTPPTRRLSASSRPRRPSDTPQPRRASDAARTLPPPLR